MDNHSFEREVLDRLMAIETQLRPLVSGWTESQKKTQELELSIARIDGRLEAVHDRIDGIYKTVAWVTGGISLFIGALQFLFTHIK